VKRLQKDALAYREATGSDAPIPADAITASGSGLDPDISPANATLQVSRVARARQVRPEQIRSVLQNHIERRQFGIFGEPRVNVLELNLALDKQLPLRAALR
jgi:K+-transporting ATPase ATPase C chain